MPIVDFHNHVYPPRYVEEIRKGPSAYTVTEDEDGNPVLHSPRRLQHPGTRPPAHGRAPGGHG